MVRWMCDVNVKDRVPSKELRERLGIDDIILILQQNRLPWYGHVLRKEDNGCCCCCRCCCCCNVTNHFFNPSVHDKFLPRDDMLAWYMLSSCVHIRPSKTVKHRIMQTRPCDSRETLVFCC